MVNNKSDECEGCIKAKCILKENDNYRLILCRCGKDHSAPEEGSFSLSASVAELIPKGPNPFCSPPLCQEEEGDCIDISIPHPRSGMEYERVIESLETIYTMMDYMKSIQSYRVEITLNNDKHALMRTYDSGNGIIIEYNDTEKDEKDGN